MVPLLLLQAQKCLESYNNTADRNKNLQLLLKLAQQNSEFSRLLKYSI